MTPATTGTADAASAPLLSVQELTVQFGSLRALDGVGLVVRPGELVALAGENGAGKSTLVRAIAGDIAPGSGRIMIDGVRIPADPAAVARRGVAVVWQDLALCNNLDVAANLLLGREAPGMVRSDTRFHLAAAAVLARLQIPLPDTTRAVGTLSGGQRQLLAVARAMHERPRLLVLDEPTAALGVSESAQVEELTASVRAQGTTVLLASHDIGQMFRLADRIIVLRHGKVCAEVIPAQSHPDDLIALISGQRTDSSARRQLRRLHGLADRLVSADASSSLPLILSALAGALDAERLALHLADGSQLRAAGGLGLPPALRLAWSELPFGIGGGPVGLAAAGETTVVDHDVRSAKAWEPWRALAGEAGIGSSWATPVIGANGLAGVITVLCADAGHPSQDELELVTLYAGYAASAVERERLLGEVTARNRVLETIQEVLETLAGPVPLSEGLPVVLQALCDGLQADAVALVGAAATAEPAEVRAMVEAGGIPRVSRAALLDCAGRAWALERRDGRARRWETSSGGVEVAVTFPTPARAGALLAYWSTRREPADATVLLEDAANSLRLAHERQGSESARQEATALRRSQELQRGFLSRLSHELRTPLTAIRGYASSLLAGDVTWDGESQERFLSRIAAESARLNRLVDDLLDFSAIESSTLRLTLDWCEVALVLDAAVSCLAPASAALTLVSCEPDLPVVWADHDRLEQVFVNLLENAFRHNPDGTRVRVAASADQLNGVRITVEDDGIGGAEEIRAALAGTARQRRSPSAGAGLGLTITRAIVEAHGGRVELQGSERGARFAIHLPVERPDEEARHAEEPERLDV